MGIRVLVAFLACAVCVAAANLYTQGYMQDDLDKDHLLDNEGELVSKSRLRTV